MSRIRLSQHAQLSSSTEHLAWEHLAQGDSTEVCGAKLSEAKLGQNHIFLIFTDSTRAFPSSATERQLLKTPAMEAE